MIDLVETINYVQGLAPETLNSLEKLVSALDNNPPFNESVMQGINQKAGTSYVNQQLSTKSNRASLSKYYLKTETDTKLNLKADQGTAYTKSQVDTTFSNLIGAAPQVLNTFQELAAALSNDANYATTVQQHLHLKNKSNKYIYKRRNY